MTTANFLENVKETFNKCIELIKEKNQHNSDKDPFEKFKLYNEVGINTDKAVLGRVSDKMSVIRNLLDREKEFDNDVLRDAINDAINYLAILKACKDEEKEEK